MNYQAFTNDSLTMMYEATGNGLHFYIAYATVPAGLT